MRFAIRTSPIAWLASIYLCCIELQPNDRLNGCTRLQSQERRNNNKIGIAATWPDVEIKGDAEYTHAAGGKHCHDKLLRIRLTKILACGHVDCRCDISQRRQQMPAACKPLEVIEVNPSPRDGHWTTIQEMQVALGTIFLRRGLVFLMCPRLGSDYRPFLHVISDMKPVSSRLECDQRTCKAAAIRFTLRRQWGVCDGAPVKICRGGFKLTWCLSFWEGAIFRPRQTCRMPFFLS